MRLRDRIIEIIEDQPLAILATSMDNIPHTTLVAFRADLASNSVFFVTPISSRKAKNIEKNPYISLIIDNRTNEVTDFRDALGITIKGEAKLVNGGYQTYFLDKHPHLKDFMNSPSTGLFKIDIEKIEVVTEFQKVYEMSINEN